MVISAVTPVRSETSPFKAKDTHLYLPRAALSNCVRAYVSRSTRGIELAPHEKLNHYAATPLCTLFWMIEGDGVLLSKGGEPVTQSRFARICLGGPQTVPSITQNLGEVRGMMAFLMPDALHALTGLDIESLVNTVLPIEDVLDASWQTMATQVLVENNDAARINCIEAFLHPRWQAVRKRDPHAPPRYFEWTNSLATRAALTGIGKSGRQFERRVKRWSGLPLQRLRGFARAESSFFAAREASERNLLNWAEVAFNMGFSDQAHMCREVRRITGFSPEEFKRTLETEEGFWLYRLWM